MAGTKTVSQNLVPKKDQIRAIKAEGELKALKKSKSKRKGSRRTRPSLTGWLAFVIAPLTYFFGGLPGFTAGAAASGDLQIRLRRGLSAIMLAYTGFTPDGRFFGRALAFGWLPIGLAFIVRKARINRMVPRGNPFIL